MPLQKAWYLENSPEVGEALTNFNRPKTRELLMLALACAFRCPNCTETHIVKSLKAGASKREVTKALLTAAVEAAGT